MYQMALYNFIAAVLFKNSPQVCVWESERDEINSESQCKILLIHISMYLSVCVLNGASTSQLPKLRSCFYVSSAFLSAAVNIFFCQRVCTVGVSRFTCVALSIFSKRRTSWDGLVNWMEFERWVGGGVFVPYHGWHSALDFQKLESVALSLQILLSGPVCVCVYVCVYVCVCVRVCGVLWVYKPLSRSCVALHKNTTVATLETYDQCQF